MKLAQGLVEGCRRQFPSLARTLAGKHVAFFDGPAGTQVPHRVISAMSHYLAHTNANHGGMFATSRESDRMLHQAHRGFADFLGVDDPDCIYFGQNMTSLTFALSRALAKTWRAGDEIIVTRLDHDANFTPWVLAARDAGVEVKVVELHRDDCTLDFDDYRSKLSPRTRLVAVGAASNATGGLNPVTEIARLAHDAGAMVFVDAVHLAPHCLIDIPNLECDFLACSAYKFFGPHLGVMWGRRELLEELEAYKVRPASSELPDKWMTGTQSHEAIAGGLAAIDYLADLGRELAASDGLNRRSALEEAFRNIVSYERELSARLLSGLNRHPSFLVHGITDLNRLEERVPTFCISHKQWRSAHLADMLGKRGLFVWHGNYYALNFSQWLGLEPHGTVRIGAVHYNTPEEVDWLLDVLDEIE
jgi:cysteine desulfurase family protein (TIGR01976 family)